MWMDLFAVVFLTLLLLTCLSLENVTTQIHPDGSADYLAHRPSELPLCTRWMVVDPSHAALGMALPATAGQ